MYPRKHFEVTRTGLPASALITTRRTTTKLGLHVSKTSTMTRPIHCLRRKFGVQSALPLLSDGSHPPQPPTTYLQIRRHRSTTPNTSNRLPLHGLKILDLTRVLAGPFCTQIVSLIFPLCSYLSSIPDPHIHFHELGNLTHPE